MNLGGRMGAGLFAILIASASTASAADTLGCMAQSYDAADLARIEALSTNFSIDQVKDEKADSLGDVAFKAAAVCADSNSWSDDQIYYAMLFEVGRLSEAAYRRSDALTADQFRKLDMALARQDRTELWAILEKSTIASLNDQEPPTTSQEKIKLGIFAIAAGVGADETSGEHVGVLLGLMSMQRYAQREFEALGKKE